MRNFQRVKADVSSGRLINREYGMMEQSQRRHLLAHRCRTLWAVERTVKTELLNTASVE